MYQRLASFEDLLHGTFYYCSWEEMAEVVFDQKGQLDLISSLLGVWSV